MAKGERNLIIDLSCPIELRSYELLNDDFGNIRAYIRLQNLSKNSITGYSATINWYNALTRARVTENISVDHCMIDPMSQFKLIHSTLNRAKIDHVEMYFSSVIYADGSEWKPGVGDLIEIGEQRLLTGAKLDRLKALAGEDAVQYPQIQKEYWRCVCGRINMLTDDRCIRCQRDRNRVLKEFNSRAVMRKDEERNARRAPQRKTQAQKKRARTGILILLLAALFMAALAFIGFHLGRDGAEIWKERGGYEQFAGHGAEHYFSAYSASNMSAS